MAEVRGEELSNYRLSDLEGNEIQDLLAFDKEAGWYQVKKRDAEGNLEEKEGEQVRLKIYSADFETKDLREPEPELEAEAEIEAETESEEEDQTQEELPPINHLFPSSSS